MVYRFFTALGETAPLTAPCDNGFFAYKLELAAVLIHVAIGLPGAAHAVARPKPGSGRPHDSRGQGPMHAVAPLTRWLPATKRLQTHRSHGEVDDKMQVRLSHVDEMQRSRLLARAMKNRGPKAWRINPPCLGPAG
jgi:hypothetical protein